MVQFDDFILDTKQARLLYRSKELAIDPKVFELLTIFTSQPNATISRQYLLEHLWSGSIVTDNAINKLIANLRKVLKDDPKNPRYIQTIPKRGYRFICDVTSNVGVNLAVETQRNKSKHEFVYKIAIFTIILLTVSMFLMQKQTPSNVPSTNYHTLELTRAQGAEESARMHPDKKHLYYLKKPNLKQKHLKKSPTKAEHQFWIKNIETSKRQQVKLGKNNITQIIAVVSGQQEQTTQLIYLDKTLNKCAVYQATLVKKLLNEQEQQTNLDVLWQKTDKLFDCSAKRIKDIDYHSQRKQIYYAAQPQNFWPNQIYVFDLETQIHSLVTQVEPMGWGHHSIDISPDGSKLLILSTNSDYKTQLLILNLQNEQMTKGIKFDYLVIEAVWHHDSMQVLYYAAPPAHQIIKSDINGNNATTVISVSENLSAKMTLFPDGKNIVFSTEQKNFSNRWLVAPEQASHIDNSVVYDTTPALFHHSQKYLFISKRSGRKQLYLGRYDRNQAEIVSNFAKSLWLNSLAISGDDKKILLNVENEVYSITTSDLDESKPLTYLSEENLIFTSKYPIISLDWLTKNEAAITTVKNGIPELKVVNVFNKKMLPLEGKWSYGVSDNQHPNYIYLIEQQSNTLYRVNSLINLTNKGNNRGAIFNTQITLPTGFYHVKIDSNTLYYGNDEKNGDYLNALPISPLGKGDKYFLNDFNGYDVKNGAIMLSDIERIEGDIYRTHIEKLME